MLDYLAGDNSLGFAAEICFLLIEDLDCEQDGAFEK
jgi:hypothetical protein